jgi:hypothetical protein
LSGETAHCAAVGEEDGRGHFAARTSRRGPLCPSRHFKKIFPLF